MFALSKRNAWKHHSSASECYHQAKSAPKPNKREKYWRTHFLCKTSLWWAPFPSDGESTLAFSAGVLLFSEAFLAVHCCKNCYYYLELTKLCSPPQGWSCWLRQLLHLWDSALATVLQGVVTDNPEKGHHNLEENFNAKFRSCFA